MHAEHRGGFFRLFANCDVQTLGRAEQACTLWRDYLTSVDGAGTWQASVHNAIGKDRIEKYKVALGLRCGQSYEAERADLTAKNWKRIVRMHRTSKLLPTNTERPGITSLTGHTGPVLCMALGVYAGDDSKFSMHVYMHTCVDDCPHGTHRIVCVLCMALRVGELPNLIVYVLEMIARFLCMYTCIYTWISALTGFTGLVLCVAVGVGGSCPTSLF
jgi:hypothetical protein